jgi:hypothetical protein
MAREDTCDTHTWTSVGVVTREGSVCRVWECENCPAWTVETFESEYERPWDDTWLAER